MFFEQTLDYPEKKAKPLRTTDLNEGGELRVKILSKRNKLNLRKQKNLAGKL